jgi:hypothetical protein
MCGVGLPIRDGDKSECDDLGKTVYVCSTTEPQYAVGANQLRRYGGWSKGTFAAFAPIEIRISSPGHCDEEHLF